MESSNTYNHVISTAGTYAISTAPGMLHSVTINSKSAAAGLITIYDSLSASGAIIAVIDAATQLGTFTFDVALTIGLTIVTAGVPGADLTVSYR